MGGARRSVESGFHSARGLAAARIGDVLRERTDTERPSRRRISGRRCSTALIELLVSPAVKRRAGIELRKRAVDDDTMAADRIVDGYKRVLKSV